jgi:small-conductance mechanosensitive channel
MEPMSTREIIDLFQHYFNLELFTVKGAAVTPSTMVVAVIAVILAFVLSSILQRVLKTRFLSRFKLDPGLEFALLRILHYCIILLGLYIALVSMNIPLGALVGFFTLLGVGIGFGLQNVANNFLSGLILLFERPIKIGDRIIVDDILGDVKQINLRTTAITTLDNISIIVPNAKLLENNLINCSYGDKRIRIHLPVGVAYGSNIDLVTRVLIEAADEEKDVLGQPKPDVWFTEFGDSSLNFELICWLPNSQVKPDVINRLNRAIDRVFREHDVEIPFPQRDLHIRSDATRQGPSVT